MRSFYPILVVAILATIGLSQVARATTQITTSNQSGDGVNPFTPIFAPPVSSTDLINGALPTAYSSSPAGYGPGTIFGIDGEPGASVLTDGADGPIQVSSLSTSNFATAGDALAGGTQFITYSLGSYGGGYTITSIATYGGWVDNGRSQQGYHVAYSTVSDPGTFIDIVPGGVFYSPPGSVQLASQVIINDSLGAPLAMSAGLIRFTFDVPVANGFEGYTELDVFGVTTPEPASLGLLAVGAIMLLRRRRV